MTGAVCSLLFAWEQNYSKHLFFSSLFRLLLLLFFFKKKKKKKERKAPGMVGDGGAETLVLCTWCSITGCWGAPGHLLVRLLSLPLCCMLGKEPLLRDVPFFSWRGPSETSLLMSPPPRLSSPLLPPSLFYSCTSWNGPPTTHQTPH